MRMPPELLFFAKLLLLVALTSVIGIWLLRRIFGRRRASRILAGMGFLAVLAIAGLVIAEIGARMAFSNVTATIDSTTDSTTYFASHWRDQERHRLNDLGFRERQIDRQKPNGVYRIAIVGDSLTYGHGVDVEQRLTNILEQRLKASNLDYEVLNFGRLGSQTVDHVEILKTYVLQIQPDYVLLQWFVNDVEGYDRSGRPQPLRLIPSDTLSSFLRAHSAFYYLVKEQWQVLQERLGVVASYNDYMKIRFSDADNKDSKRANRHLIQFIRICRQRSIPVGLLVYPRLANAQYGYPLAFLLKRVLEQCQKRDIPCLDMRTAFADVDPPTQLWVNDLNSYPGYLANRLAADAVLEKFGTLWAVGGKN